MRTRVRRAVTARRQRRNSMLTTRRHQVVLGHGSVRSVRCGVDFRSFNNLGCRQDGSVVDLDVL
jgi:hypothetical protein